MIWFHSSNGGFYVGHFINRISRLYSWTKCQVVLSIVIITIIIYMCLLPLTIKQQKFSKLSQKMQPEMQAIQAKYKNKKDQASMMAMQEETQLLYQKYGISPMGSCVQMLIQMPILFALYRVFYNIPAYLSGVKGSFTGLVDSIQQTSGYQDTLVSLMEKYNVVTSSVNINAEHYRWLLFLISGKLKRVLIDYLACGYIF